MKKESITSGDLGTAPSMPAVAPTAPSQDEMLARARFATVAAAVQARKTDLMNISADKAAFNAQKDQPGGKTTFKSYLWSVCGDAYDQAHPRN